MESINNRIQNDKIIFVDPLTKEALKVVNGSLVTESGRSYLVKNEVPDLIFPNPLSSEDQKTKRFYEGRAQQYEDTIHLTFFTVNENEEEVRNTFIDKLSLEKQSKVLEIACGTGRDSVLIAKRLGPEGELHLQDISEDMMQKCVEKLSSFDLKRSFCLSNANHLPYPDNYFDATYSFGAMGEFSDKKRAISEMVRVTKKGGKVVFGDESIPVWHRNTEFYRILKTTNYMFEEKVPFKDLPVESRNVNVKWVIGGTFYLVDFEVGDGEPQANFDFEIPGIRGGTYRTRYEGQLEGVSAETKQKAVEYVKKNKLSMHSWLNEIVLKAINK